MTTCEVQVSKSDASKEETVHKRHRCPIKDLSLLAEENLRSPNNAFNMALARHNQLTLVLEFSPSKLGHWTSHVLTPPLCNIPSSQINKENEFPLLKIWNQQKLELKYMWCIVLMHICCDLTMMVAWVFINVAKTLAHDH
jgi:hypothetical protein